MYTKAGATISADLMYRYRLFRSWDPEPDAPDSGSRTCCFIMLNPSTADGEKDDPTIRKCVGFAKQLGCTSLQVVNLFAYRSTNPKMLKTLSPAQAIGPENNAYLLTHAVRARTLIAAWGANGHLFKRDDAVKKLLADIGLREKLQALRLTEKWKDPEHPLYIPYGLPLVPVQ